MTAHALVLEDPESWVHCRAAVTRYWDGDVTAAVAAMLDLSNESAAALLAEDGYSADSTFLRTAAGRPCSALTAARHLAGSRDIRLVPALLETILGDELGPLDREAEEPKGLWRSNPRQLPG